MGLLDRVLQEKALEPPKDVGGLMGRVLDLQKDEELEKKKSKTSQDF